MVLTAGELNDFALELLKLTAAGNKGRQPARLELPGASLAVDMHSLGQNYVNTVKPLLKDTPRFIDKLPLNSLYVGVDLSRAAASQGGACKSPPRGHLLCHL